MSDLMYDRMNNRVVLNCLCRQSVGLNIVHMNCQSARRKMDEIKYMIGSAQVDILCLSETWFTPDISSSAIGISGYKIFRQDRAVGRGGGVAILVRSSLNVRMVEGSTIGLCDYVVVEVKCHSEKITVISAYNPHRNNDIEPLFNIFSELSSRYNNLIIAGDLNKNVLSQDAIASRFLSDVLGAGLHMVNRSEPTHFSGETATLIDVFLTTNLEKVLFYNQLSVPGISGHDLIFLTYELQPSPQSNTSFSYRDYNRVNAEELIREVVGIPWYSVFSMPDPVDQVEFFNANVNYLYEKYVPFRTRSVNRSPPWFNTRVLRLISERDYLYYVWKRNRTVENKERFRRLRNLTTATIRASKKQYYQSKLDTKLSPKQLWKNLREIGVGKPRNVECDLDPNELSSHFIVSPSSRLPSTAPGSSTDAFDSDADGREFNFRGVTNDEVLDTAFAIHSNAIGTDGISPRFLKLILPYVAPVVTHIFNTCISSSSFPTQWKTAIVIPIPKSKQSSSPEQFRPISILPYLSKIFEKLLNRQMMDYVAAENLLIPWQSGFRPDHSCTSALIGLTDDIRVGIDQDMASILVLLDFTKAFDSVPHIILCRKLEDNFNFSHLAIKLISNFLSNRSQVVKVRETFSHPRWILCGVPQGSILSPSLFSMFINDLSSCLKFSKIIMYADDVQIYISRVIGLLEDGVSRINEDLQAIWAWAESNGLILNERKSQAIIIYKRALDTQDLSPILLNNSVIKFVNVVRNLGLIMNNTLSWEHHVDSIIGKIYGGLRSLWFSASFTPQLTRLKLVKSLLIPLIMFGVEIYGCLDAESSRKLNVAFNSCVRYVYKLRRYDHVSSFSSTLLGCSLNQFIKYRTVVFLRNLMTSGRPEYLFSKLSFAASSRTRSLILPRFTVLQSKRSFFVHAIRLWNSLPSDLRRTAAMTTFKSKALEHFKTN